MTTSNHSSEIATPTLGTALADHARKSLYLKEIVDTLEIVNSESFLLSSGQAPTIAAPSEMVSAALRFADIFSHSTVSAHRALSYRLIALLHELSGSGGLELAQKDSLIGVTESVLIELGNFPAIETLRRRTDKVLAPSISKATTRAVKQQTNRTKSAGQMYTDAQLEVAERLEKSSYFSFSGPTSLGKSFILKDRIYGLASSADLKDKAIVVLVPTRALISQTVKDLEKALGNVSSVHVSQQVALPLFIRKKHELSVLVFTPERLLNYVTSPARPIAHLFVDEAQKVIADTDSRSPLYYHAINEALRRFATNLAFASPNISNPEIFLQLFTKSEEGAVTVSEKTVAQNRYFVDLIERKVQHFGNVLEERTSEFEMPSAWGSQFDVVHALSRGNQSIVYINSASRVVLDAMRFAAMLANVEDSRLESLMDFAHDNVHEQYYLIECLRKGVAFHHGRMPQELREKIEDLYSSENSPIRYVFCTSTLLEGVNLPAKNIFVLSDKHGLRKLTQLDFENLIGRAGRLTRDFAGNVICVRDKESSWANGTLDLLKYSSPSTAKSFLVNPAKRSKKEFTDIEKCLSGDPLPSDRSVDSKRISQQYASILTVHEKESQSSNLRSLFLEKIVRGSEKLRRAAESVDVPANIIRRTPDIATEYQDKVFSLVQSEYPFAPLFSSDSDLSSNDVYLNALRRLHVAYSWRTEESVGLYTLVPKKDLSADETQGRLRYWANLMRSWVTGRPLHLIIKSSLRYYEREGQITVRDFSAETTYKTVRFLTSDSYLVNYVIEEVLRDVEVGLRFRIMRYLQNYFDISSAVHGRPAAGIDLGKYVEYGTFDPISVALQNVGISRQVSIELSEKFPELIRTSDDGELYSIDLERILEGLSGRDESVREVVKIFGAL